MKKGDYILIGILVILSSVPWFYIENFIQIKTEAAFVVVKYEGEVVQEVELKPEMDQIYRVALKTSFAQIQIKDSKVRMLKMPKSICPRNICSEFGWIEKNREIIACIPNKLTMEINNINSPSNNPIVDDVSY